MGSTNEMQWKMESDSEQRNKSEEPNQRMGAVSVEGSNSWYL